MGPPRRRDPDHGSDAILPLPAPREAIASATAFRSTWVLSSIESLQLGGYWERYQAVLSDHRDAILSCVPGAWLPMRVARAHYRACDALGLSSREVAALGANPGNQARQGWRSSFVADAAKTKSAWDALSQLHRMWQRSADGGAVAVYRLDRHVARVEYVGCELFEIPFFRFAIRAALVRLLEPLALTTVVRELAQPPGDEGHYLVRWSAQSTGAGG
jgi:hypothetical protein